MKLSPLFIPLLCSFTSCLFTTYVNADNNTETIALSLESAIESGISDSYDVIRARNRLWEKSLEAEVAGKSRYSTNLYGRLLWRSDRVFEADNNINDDNPVRRRVELKLDYMLYDGNFSTLTENLANREKLLEQERFLKEKTRAKRIIYELYLIASEKKEDYDFYSNLKAEHERLVGIVVERLKKKKILPYVKLQLQAQTEELNHLIFNSESEYSACLDELRFLSDNRNRNIRLTDRFPDSLSGESIRNIIARKTLIDLNILEKKAELEMEKLRHVKAEESLKVELVGSVGINNSFSPAAPLLKSGVVLKKRLNPSRKKISLARLKTNNAVFELAMAKKEMARLIELKAGKVARLNSELDYKKKRLAFLEEKRNIFRMRFEKGRMDPEKMLAYFRDYFKGYEAFKKAKIRLYSELGGIAEMVGTFEGIVR